MVPFPMRLLHAQLPIELGSTQLAMNRTCLLQNTTQQILSTIRRGHLPLSDQKLAPEEQRIAERVWLSRLVRVKFALCRCLMAVGVSGRGLRVLLISLVVFIAGLLPSEDCP